MFYILLNIRKSLSWNATFKTHLNLKTLGSKKKRDVPVMNTKKPENRQWNS